MRDLKPLQLPRLVAARKNSKSSLDLVDPSASMYSCTDSSVYSASGCSTPPTPAHSVRGHFRYPSSSSSLSSTPPNHDSFDLLNASGKLPKLTEEPVEREDVDMLDCHSCVNSVLDLDQATPDVPVFGAAFDYDVLDVFSTDPSDLHMAKRRRSGESATQSLTEKIGKRFPSLTRKVRERQRSSTVSSSSRSAPQSLVPSRNPSLKLSSTRTLSNTNLVQQPVDISPATARSSNERLDQFATPSPADMANADFAPGDTVPEAVERLASTPLLPPVVVKVRDDDVPTQSPLQSPTVADPGHSIGATPIGTPPVRAYPTPPLSTKPSVSSFKAPRAQLVPAADTDIPPIMLTDPNDKWADKLSHANFTIQPEPYMPDVCDAASLRQLCADWEQARCNFTKHLVRTGEHFGVTSKLYKLTEQKWAEIDAQWKANMDLATSRAAALGAEPEATSPMEPAPLTKMPLLSDPKSEGKFPELGDEDIVGPMVQIAAQIQKSPSRKRALLKFFSDMKFPNSFLRRSSDIPSH
ncbi:uncharacterized protein EI97DRAFT_164580 [Westerdykella ornata]|uniref:Only prolin and serin are matching in the corresponding protein n=1 Tax=Westerdykella ornata TaxID=318751 RepID=A0A6A6J9H6_WESOR|nr:uncharacterized protein EI97DRAFT_164580 [Westerdykella ornata]KAF2273221.1 hypothetical protein EI97DRAFT_164580 [Westerdykella ornata]